MNLHLNYYSECKVRHHFVIYTRSLILVLTFNQHCLFTLKRTPAR